MSSVISYVLKLKVIQDNRRVLALALLAVAGVLQVLTSPDFLNECRGAEGGFCAWVGTAQHTLIAAATYVGAVGVFFKSDSAIKE